MTTIYKDVSAQNLSQIPDYWWNYLLDGNLFYIRLNRFPFPVEHYELTTYLYRRAYRNKRKVSCRSVVDSDSGGVYVQAYEPSERLRGNWSPAHMAAAREAPKVPLVRARVPLVNGQPDPDWGGFAPASEQLPLPHERKMTEPEYEVEKPKPFMVASARTAPVTQPVILDRDDPNYSARADPENDWIFEVCSCGADSTSMYQHDQSCGVWQL